MESTQIVARQLAEQGAPEGTVVLAGEQTGGRGRLGREFFSPPGGLYVSILLRPPFAPARAPLIGVAAGLALAEAIQGLAGLRPVLKWPNDLLLGGRKISGLLIDLPAGSAVLGIGVNVNIPTAALPVELRASATSLLHELGHELDLESLLDALLLRFEARYVELCSAGPEPLLAAWRAAPNLLGQRVRVAAPAEVLEGIAHDLDVDGALLLRLPSGEFRRVIAADVHLLQ